MLSRSRVSATLPYEGLRTAPAFYGRKLGLEQVGGSVKEGHLEFAAGGNTTIAVFESDSRKSDDTSATFEVANLAREMTALRRKGIRFEEYDLPGIKTVDGVATMGEEKAAWFKDPGGNVLCLHQPGRARKS